MLDEIERIGAMHAKYPIVSYEVSVMGFFIRFILIEVILEGFDAAIWMVQMSDCLVLDWFRLKNCYVFRKIYDWSLSDVRLWYDLFEFL